MLQHEAIDYASTRRSNTKLLHKWLNNLPKNVTSYNSIQVKSPFLAPFPLNIHMWRCPKINICCAIHLYNSAVNLACFREFIFVSVFGAFLSVFSLLSLVFWGKMKGESPNNRHPRNQWHNKVKSNLKKNRNSNCYQCLSTAIWTFSSRINTSHYSTSHL